VHSYIFTAYILRYTQNSDAPKYHYACISEGTNSRKFGRNKGSLLRKEMDRLRNLFLLFPEVVMLNGDVTFSQYCAVYDVQFTTPHVSLNSLLSLCFSVSIRTTKLERDKETVHRIYCPVPTPRYTVKERRNKAEKEYKKEDHGL